MFVSFFPRPKLFFWSALVWSLLAVLGWYEGGERLGAIFGLPPPGARRSADYRCEPVLVGTVSLVLYIFRGGDIRLLSFLGLVFTAPVATLVHTWIGTDPVHYLFRCAGQRCGQCLVWAVLRSCSKGADNARSRQRLRLLLGHGHICRNSLYRCDCRCSEPVFRQPLYLPLAFGDE